MHIAGTSQKCLQQCRQFITALHLCTLPSFLVLFLVVLLVIFSCYLSSPFSLVMFLVIFLVNLPYMLSQPPSAVLFNSFIALESTCCFSPSLTVHISFPSISPSIPPLLQSTLHDNNLYHSLLPLPPPPISSPSHLLLHHFLNHETINTSVLYSCRTSPTPPNCTVSTKRAYCQSRTGTQNQVPYSPCLSCLMS